jgi:atypical dual specificity phosphatase
MRYHFIPVENYKVPDSFNPVDSFIQTTLMAAHTMHRQGRVLARASLVHCGGGKGRAGTFLACYMIRCGLEFPTELCAGCEKIACRQDQLLPICQITSCSAGPPKMSAADAIRILRQLRPGSVETTEQELFIKRYSDELWKRAEQPPMPEEEESPLSVQGSLSPVISLIVLCGLPGSGKSWFSSILEQSGGYVRVCQDDMGSRNACERAVGNAARSGRPIVVDRCNPTPDDRLAWYKCAMQPSHAICVHFSASVATCLARTQRRLFHPTLSNTGRARAAIRQFAKTFDAPTKSEPFEAVVTVPSFAAAHEFLRRLGIVVNNQTDGGDKKQQFYKFPRTRHLMNLGSVTRDDLLLSDSDRAIFMRPPANYTLTIEEKVDGANLGISIDDNHAFLVQNRSHFVNSAYHTQFKALDSWLSSHTAELFEVLRHERDGPGRWILFGEWLVATHSIPYDRLPGRFVAFDLFDTHSGKFLSRQKLGEQLSAHSTIPCVPRVTYTLPLTESILKDMANGESMFYDGRREGIYLRLDEGDFLAHRSKIVRGDFIAGNDNWSKGIIRWNRLL